MIDIELPDLRGHPLAPNVSLADFERYVIDVWIPQTIACGEVPQESFISNFMNNVGRQTGSWPDFSGIES